MKKTIAVLFALISAAVFAGANDLLIMFSTPGPDKYADDTVVLDGESYALVWTGKDGTQKTVLSVPFAKDGKCSPVLFVVDENDAPQYAGGTWGVYLLDSRDFDKDPTGKTLAALDASGKPSKVNVKASVAAAEAAVLAGDIVVDTAIGPNAADVVSLREAVRP